MYKYSNVESIYFALIFFSILHTSMIFMFFYQISEPIIILQTVAKDSSLYIVKYLHV